MPGLDWIPGVSQLKSAVQLLTGDVEGAARTQQNFFQECPIVSQATSTAQLICGDVDGALETQKRCFGTINNVANGIPVVGHVKGIVHHAVGDHKRGNQALNAATRSSVVLASGAAAGIATGGLGAIPAGIAAGSAYDLGDSLISEKPKGLVAAVDHAVNNPSAGSIFDATAVVVGDGLTGYAGGKIGKNVASQVKLSKLEAARAAKAEQLNVAFEGQLKVSKLKADLAATVEEINSGLEKGSSLTSGDMAQLDAKFKSINLEIDKSVAPQTKLGKLEALSGTKTDIPVTSAKSQMMQMGKQIKSLTAEIKTIRHSTPQCWFDAKNNRVMVEGGVAGPSSQYTANSDDDDDDDNDKFVKEHSVPETSYRRPLQELETGFDVDFYPGEVDAGVPPEEKRKTLNDYKNGQVMSSMALTKAYKKTKITLDEDLSELEVAFDNGDDPRENFEYKDKLESEFLTTNRWFHVRMPKQFGYTGAIMTNSSSNGLLHSFRRHWSQWQEHIPELDSTFMQRFEPIRRELEVLQNSRGQRQTEYAAETLNAAIENLDRATQNEIQENFFEAQLRIHRFIQDNVTYSQYLGEWVSNKKDVRLFFKVKDQNGNMRVMAIGVSRFSNPSMVGFNDPRRVRQIITVFFMTWDEFSKLNYGEERVEKVW